MRRSLRLISYAAIALAVNLFTNAGQAEAQGSIQIGGPDFPPFYEMVDGRMGGFLTDTLSLIVENGGYTWSGTILPAARLIAAISEGQVHASLSVLNRTLEDSPAVTRSPEPITEIVLNVYSFNDTFPIKSKEDLRGQTIIVMRGYGYGGLRAWLDDAANNVTVLQANSFASAINMLKENRAPLALLYDVNYDAGIKSLEKIPDNIFTNNFLRIPAYIYLSKAVSENHQSTMDRLMASYRELLSRGVLSAPTNRPEILKKEAQG